MDGLLWLIGGTIAFFVTYMLGCLFYVFDCGFSSRSVIVKYKQDPLFGAEDLALWQGQGKQGRIIFCSFLFVSILMVGSFFWGDFGVSDDTMKTMERVMAAIIILVLVLVIIPKYWGGTKP